MKSSWWAGMAGIVAGLGCALGPSAAWADLVVRERYTDMDGKRVGDRTVTLAEGRTRIDLGDTSVILDLPAGRQYLVDHRKKAYAEFDVAAAAAGARAAESRLKATLGPGFARYRDARKAEGAVQLVPTGDRKTIKGFQAESVQVQSRTTVVVAWFATKIDVRPFLAPIEKAATASGDLAGLSSELALLRGARDRGYPVRVEFIATGESREVESVQQAPQPASVFTAPAGYRKARLAELVPGAD